jgi:hypothetical protein
MKPAGFPSGLDALVRNTAAFRESLNIMGGRGIQWISVGISSPSADGCFSARFGDCNCPCIVAMRIFGTTSGSTLGFAAAQHCR